VTMSDLFDIGDKVVMISGATGALGSALSHGLARAGAKVLITGRSEHKLKPLADAITDSGFTADYEAGAPDDPEAVRHIADAALERFGGIDVLVTAAGMNKPAPIVDQPPEDWQAVLDSQLKTTWLFCQAVGRVMIDQNRGGKVILIGSQRGDLGMANYSAYSPAKAAVHLLAKTLGCEWGPYNIQVNCLAPGLFRSELTDWMWSDEAVYRRLLARVPHGRLGEPEDFIGPVMFLASAASDWMTGAVLAVDGGYTAG
jgi:NAD(P)-dependent dehydrogenase (short-subunit alcohol dehydrogenase family)